MSATDAAIGMMDGAYFTSRSEILSFLNGLLDLNLTKVEQTASGAVACQLTEYIFPGSVPMAKVNWAARASHEYVGNYKLLQNAFNKNKIQKHVDVDKLIRGKYQDNLEFCQWLKAFFDQTAPMMRGGREGYDPVAVRAKGKGGKAVGTNKGGAVRKPGASSARTGAAARTGASARAVGTARTGAPARPPVRSSSTRSTASSGSARSTASRPASASSSSSRAAASKENTANARPPAPPRSSKAGVPSAASAAKLAKLEEENRALQSDNASLKTKYAELERASAEMELTFATVEGERDFYFEKLRGIEVMLQVYKEHEEAAAGSGNVNRVMDRIFKVMYATMEDDVAVDDEGNLVGDVTVEDSIDQSALVSTVEDSIDQSALVSPKAQDDLGDDDEELLTSGLDETAANVDVVPEEPVEIAAVEAQFSSDSDDEELLTDGLDSPVAESAVEPAEPVANVAADGEGEFKECLDEDSFDDDEDLLAD